MIVRLYGILDVKAKAFGPLLQFPNDDMVRRAMSQPAPRDSDLAKYPEDFQMYYLGQMDLDSGAIQGATPVLLASFSEFVAKEV